MKFVTADTKDAVACVSNTYLDDLILKNVSLKGLGLFLGMSVQSLTSLSYFFNVLYNPGYKFSLISNR